MKLLAYVGAIAALACAAGAAHAQSSAPAAPAPHAAVAPFSDVPRGHWAYQAVNELRQLGIVAGYPGGAYDDANARDFTPLHYDAREHQALDTLRKAGFVIGYSPVYGIGRPAMTPLEFAESVARLLPLLNPGMAGPANKDASVRRMARMLTAHEPALAALKALVIGFRPQLEDLGVDATGAIARIDRLEEQAGHLKPE